MQPPQLRPLLAAPALVVSMIDRVSLWPKITME